MPRSSLPPPTKPTSISAIQGKPSASGMFIGAVEDEWQLFSDRSTDYTLGSPIGFGASSIVYAASYQPQPQTPLAPPPPPIPCALKVLDLDSLPPHSLSLLQRETTLMSLSKHPNVLRVRGSWMDGHKLYIALRLMNKGSAADVMRYGWPGGMEEDVIRCILRQALKGLNYLHINGFIHRDIKAANLLIDDDGTVLLGDLGVAANLAEDISHSTTARSHSISASTALAQSQHQILTHSSGGSNQSHKRVVLFDAVPILPRPKMGKRKSFVGTPCWMAPELIQGKQYDSSADIWSFGITALELTQGRPPRSRDPPQRVLLKTIQDAPPTLDREGGTYKYSRAFKEMVESCLVKDPSQRPTAEQLLQTPFFKSSKKKSYLVGAILKDLPPLTHRQERVARNPHALTHHSIDSWDFATTLNSPTTSVLRRRRLEEMDLVAGEWDGEWEAEEIGRVFEMEGEGEGEGISEGREEGKSHSKAVLWGGDDVVEEGQTQGREAEAETEVETEAVPSSSSTSPSDSDFPDTSLAPSPATGSSPATSVVETESKSLPITPKPTDIGFKARNVPGIPEGPMFSPLGLASSAPATTATVRRVSSQGLWQKLKGAGGKDREKGKEKGGVGGLFSRKTGGGMNALTRTTSRTAQVVGFLQGK